MRLLCDLSARGEKIVRECLGLPPRLSLAPNWNGGPEGDPSSASILLPREMFRPLAVFCLLDDGAVRVFVTRTNGIYGIFPADEQEKDKVTSWRQLMEHIYGSGEIEQEYVLNTNLPGAGTRCEHLVSGRVG
jgi:hypothetical protein